MLFCLLMACRVGQAQQPQREKVATAVSLTAAVQPTATTPSETQVAPASAKAEFFYGVAQPITTAAAGRSPKKIARELREIKALKANVVAQVFPAELSPKDWENYLNIAHQEGISVVGKIGPAPWNPDPADLFPIMNVLAVVGDHPALYGFFYLHEPWKDFETAQMQAMYREIKAAHPNVRLAVLWSGQIGISVDRGNPERQFTDDLCDICVIDLKSFQSAKPEQHMERLEKGAHIIHQVDPDAELWSADQVWAPKGENPMGWRVPSPQEMETLFCTLKRTYDLQGFLWEYWTWPRSGAGALGDPESVENRKAVRDIYERCVENP